MSSIGRNDPCYCGSGKKYKQCHAPIDAEIATAQRKLKRAPDTLLPKVLEALDRFGVELPAALNRFWNGAYNVHDVKELDDHEDRGSERFLTWFAFDAQDEQGTTPAQRLATDPEGLELTAPEAQVLRGWGDVRLQPYEIVTVRKGQGLEVRPLFGEGTLYLEDHKAARRVEPGEVLIAHLIPASDVYYVAGAAAQLTPDTALKLREFASVHLEDLRRSRPDATYADLIRHCSHIFNHFVMALPREEHEIGKLDELVAMTRATLNVTAQQIGLRGEDEGHSLIVPAVAEADADTDADVAADSDANAVCGLGDTSQTLETGGIEDEQVSATAADRRSYDGIED